MLKTFFRLYEAQAILGPWINLEISKITKSFWTICDTHKNFFKFFMMYGEKVLLAQMASYDL